MEVIGRKEQINKLVYMLRLCPSSSAILCFGSNGTGKSLTVKSVLDDNLAGFIHGYSLIDMVETTYIKQDLFYSILIDLEKIRSMQKKKIDEKYLNPNNKEINTAASSSLSAGPLAALLSSSSSSVLSSKQSNTSASSNYETIRMKKMMENQEALAHFFGDELPKPKKESAIEPSASASSSSAKQDSLPLRCDNKKELIVEIQKRLPIDGNKPFVIVLDNFEKLDDMEMIRFFVRIAEFSQRNIITILISSNISNEIGEMLRINAVASIDFPVYSYTDMSSIMNLLANKYVKNDENVINEDDFRKYVKFVMDAMYSQTKSVYEIRFSLDCLWPIFSQSMKKKKLSTETTNRVQKSLEYLRPFIGVLCRRLGLHYVLTDDDALRVRNNQRKLIENSSSFIAVKQQRQNEENERFQGVKLPYYLKVLLVASYIASYSPIEHDLKLFTNMRVKAKKARKQSAVPNAKHGNDMNNIELQEKNAADMLPQHLQGPRNFEMERLLWIFRSLLIELVGNETALRVLEDSSHSLIFQLESTKLIERVSKDDDIMEVKYKCLASFEFSNFVAESISLDLGKYLPN